MNYARFLFFISIACAITAVVIFGLALNKIAEPTAAPLMAGTALLAASAGWIFTNFVTLNQKIRERTFEYVREVSTKRELSKFSNEISAIWRRDNLRVASEADCTSYFIKTYPDGDLIKAMAVVGNFFEEMSVAIELGTVDEQMLKRCFIDMLKLFVGRVVLFLPAFRNDPLVADHPYGPRKASDVFKETMQLWEKWK